MENYNKALVDYKHQRAQYIRLIMNPRGDSARLKVPKRPEHPYITELKKHKTLFDIAGVVENGIKDFEDVMEKQNRRQVEPWNIHDINRAAFIPGSIRAYLRFSEVMKENVKKKEGENLWFEREMGMQPTGFFGAKMLIPISDGFVPDSKHPAHATLAEVMVLDPAQFEAYERSHPVYETIRTAKESSKPSGGRSKDVMFSAEKMPVDAEHRLEAEYMGHMNYFRRLNKVLARDRARQNTPESQRGNNSFFALIDEIKERHLKFHGAAQVDARLGELLKLHQSVHAVGASRASGEWRKLYIYHALKHNAEQPGNDKVPRIPEDIIMDIDPEMYNELSGLFDEPDRRHLRAAKRAAKKKVPGRR